jgi:hypothetical protein
VHNAEDARGVGEAVAVGVDLDADGAALVGRRAAGESGPVSAEAAE